MFNKVLALFIFIFSVNSSFAKTTVIHKKTVLLPVDISTAKLKWTNLGYGGSYFVKVIIPELAEETILNHRNEGEDGPCLFTRDTDKLSDVIQDNPETIHVPFEIELVKITQFNSENKCFVTLQENIIGDIRGFEFFHSRSEAMPSRHIDDCK